MRAKITIAATSFLVGAILTPTTTGIAQPSAGPRAFRIGVVRIAEAMNRFAQTIDLEAIFRERGLQFDAENEKRQEVLTQRAKELMRFKADTPERNARERDLVRLQAEYEIHARLIAAQLDRQQRIWLQRTYQRVSQAAGDLARERGLDTILATRPPEFVAADANALKKQIVAREILYTADSLDLTDALLERLNTEYGNRGGKQTLLSKMEPLTDL